MIADELLKLGLSRFAKQVLTKAKSVRFFNTAAELAEAAVPEDKVDERGYFTVGYDVDGRFVPEAKVCRVRNGISANYFEPYMRRRDPNCMVIADDRATDKQTYENLYHEDFGPLREETFRWLETQDVACFFFDAGLPGKGLPAMAICPANAAFFAFGLATLQGIVPLEQISGLGEAYYHSAIIYIAPPFRHTHFDGKQVVVHNRREELHELFSYNLYPGPSAKKGVYGMLLNFGERHGWNTAHCSTVQVLTPYDNTVTMMHEGASGGGKSEMLEQMHRELDGRLKLGTNLVTDERRYVLIPRGCELRPVTDDMALCHPEFQDSTARERKLSLMDAEHAWFLRVNHINQVRHRSAPGSAHHASPGAALVSQYRCRSRVNGAHLGTDRGRAGKALPQPAFGIPSGELPGHRQRSGNGRYSQLRRAVPALHPRASYVRNYRTVSSVAAVAGVALAAGSAARARQPVDR